MVKEIRYKGQTLTCHPIKGTKASLRCGPKRKKGGKHPGRKKSGRGRGKHNTHRTKRGLAQDQKRKSKEPHEKAYRKQKRAGKR